MRLYSSTETDPAARRFESAGAGGWIFPALVFWIFLFGVPSPGRAGEPFEPDLSPDGVYRTEIVVDSYSFKPDHLRVEAGRPVELTLRSVTFIVPHNVVIQVPEAGLDVRQDVPAGGTVQVRFAPTVPGRYEIFCDKKLLFFASHKEKGMTGTLEVVPAEAYSRSE